MVYTASSTSVFNVEDELYALTCIEASFSDFFSPPLFWPSPPEIVAFRLQTMFPSYLLPPGVSYFPRPGGVSLPPPSSGLAPQHAFSPLLRLYVFLLPLFQLLRRLFLRSVN